MPEHVSHINFWKRFLFRKALLEDEESRLEIKEKKEKQQAEQLQWEKGKVTHCYVKLNYFIILLYKIYICRGFCPKC